MTSLRDELDVLLEQHYDGSVLGRQQCLDDIMAAIDKRVSQMAAMIQPSTQANESGLRPKPLDQQVPGAWNFEGPPPNSAGQPLGGVIHIDGPVAAGTVIARLEEGQRVASRRRARGAW